MTAISTAACGANGAACQACNTMTADNCDTGGCRCGTNPSCGAGTRCVNSQCVCDSVSCGGTACCANGVCQQTVTVNACGSNGQACMTCDTTVANNCGDGTCRCGNGPACSAGQRCFNSQCVCDATTCADGCCSNGSCIRNQVSQCGTAGGTCAACDTRADNCGPSGCRCGLDAVCMQGVTCMAGRCGPPAWMLIPTTNTPSARSDFMMAYDVTRARVVVFGGEATGGGRIGDTWEYAPATRAWTSVAFTGPSTRRNAAMAYDPVRNQTVLFGGDTGVGLDDSTWVWNGATWTQRTTTVAPSARHSAAMAWSPQRQTLMLFGGLTNTGASNDLWEWNGTAWAQVSTTGAAPPVRSASSMAYDVARNRMVIFGGVSNTLMYGDTWELVGTAWQASSATLTARYQAAMGWHGPSAKVVLVGGTNSLSGTGAITGSAELTSTAWNALPTTPTSRGWSRMVYDSNRQRLILFGGYGVVSGTTTSYLNDVWEY